MVLLSTLAANKPDKQEERGPPAESTEEGEVKKEKAFKDLSTDPFFHVRQEPDCSGCTAAAVPEGLHQMGFSVLQGLL